MLTQSEKPVVGPLHKSGGADSQKLSVATKFKVYQRCLWGDPKYQVSWNSLKLRRTKIMILEYPKFCYATDSIDLDQTMEKHCTYLWKICKNYWSWSIE